MWQLIVWYSLFQCLKSLKMPFKNVYVMTKLVNSSNDFCIGLSFLFCVVSLVSFYWFLIFAFGFSDVSLFTIAISSTIFVVIYLRVPMEQRFHFLEGVGGGWRWRYVFFISFLLPLFLEKFIIDLKDAKHK